MEYSDAYLREHLPSEPPPFELIPLDVIDDLERWIQRSEAEDPLLLARSTQWTYAIFSEIELGQYSFVPPFVASPEFPWLLYLSDRLERASVGLFDVDFHPGFGIIVEVPSLPAPQFTVLTTLFFPRLRATFPLAVRESGFEPHLHHPATATSACWAQCNSTRLWGVLTAGHALRRNRPGGSVSLAGGGQGILVRSGYQPIDAAFVTLPHPPATPRPLGVLSFPAAGQPVTVECRSGPQHRTIVTTMNSMGVNMTSAFAVLFYLDDPCVPGDSGSLVRIMSGEAAGVYKGAMTTPVLPSGVCGIVQNFEQAIFTLGVTPYL